MGFNGICPLVNKHSYGKLPMIEVYSFEHGDFPVRYAKLPEGIIFMSDVHEYPVGFSWILINRLCICYLNVIG